MSKEKIFIGLLDIASQISDWNKGFEQLGHETFTVTFRSQHVAQRNEVDVVLDDHWRPSYRGVRPRKLQAWLQDHKNFFKNRIFRRALEECDVFIIVGRSFYLDYSDFAEIKKRGKKLICVFTGDDSRWYHCMKQEFEMYGMPPMVYEPGYDYSLANLESHLAHLRNAEKFADVIVSIPNQAQMALRPYHLFICALDMDMFPHNIEQRDIPVVVHAPSNPHFKGTEYFLSAVERLKGEGVRFDFELIQGVPNRDAVKRYQNADIILNQVFAPGGGKLAHEGMALGKVVLTKMGYDNKYDEQTPHGCPLVDVSPDTVYSELKRIILNSEERRERALLGRAYVERNNKSEKVAERFLRILNEKKEPDFIPVFFRDYFVPESDDASLLYNKWNKYVSDCSWYKSGVGHFKRGSLEF